MCPCLRCVFVLTCLCAVFASVCAFVSVLVCALDGPCVSNRMCKYVCIRILYTWYYISICDYLSGDINDPIPCKVNGGCFGVRRREVGVKEGERG